MDVGELCTRDVCVMSPYEPLVLALREMHDRHVGSVIVVRMERGARYPVGIITDRDVLCAQLRRRSDLLTLNVSDVMTPNVLSVSEHTGIAEAVAQMRTRSVRRAPVVGKAGELVGVISLDDVLPEISRNLAVLASLLGSRSEVKHWNEVYGR
jgi:CBS domain-containing protein